MVRGRKGAAAATPFNPVALASDIPCRRMKGTGMHRDQNNHILSHGHIRLVMSPPIPSPFFTYSRVECRSGRLKEICGLCSSPSPYEPDQSPLPHEVQPTSPARVSLGPMGPAGPILGPANQSNVTAKLFEWGLMKKVFGPWLDSINYHIFFCVRRVKLVVVGIKH